ncbi:NCS2 family permease [Wohlfahrtiimonas chitiniclastica]|uniref:NCS2 family permease n=1 Tax=Wohlfahrtiimonas chitiniclastica TaxID=400946 RepID=UPI000B97D356|nr:NCS2 family permease [Wohlfahrtiimonas chitiniclastica]MBS7827873.1 NCS2 family permease [Wohlfahrtiimonas chitiniclastica]OYQ89424.1 guanine permease [Wohlfahrtiimonas chitiniclastica]OYQ89990.1 guanine permease [Wohlfahrtiimonas chitiniclastica]
MLERIFKLREHKTNVQTEVLGGMTTFLAMSYIIFVNPIILSKTGMDMGSVFVATCVAAAIGTFIMAFLANYPIAVAPGMGLNAFFAFTIVANMGFTWQQALGGVFVSGVIFLILTATGLRSWIIEGIPASLRASVAAGIGLFLAFIGLQSAQVVVDDSATLVKLGSLSNPTVLFCVLGFLVIAVLDALKVKGAILIGILVISALSIFTGNTHFAGIVSMPPSIAPTFFQIDFSKVLEAGFLQVILTLVLVELFDATGVLIGVAKRAKILDDTSPENKKRFSRALFADSTSILAGSMLGTSSVTAYVESASGVQAGGRTGLTSATVAVLFLVALFFSPLLTAVPAYATAPALIYLACLMLRELTEVNWDDLTDAIPAALMAFTMAFTYSIANGFAFAFISYVVLKVFTGKFRQVHPATYIIAALFLVKFILYSMESATA